MTAGDGGAAPPVDVRLAVPAGVAWAVLVVVLPWSAGRQAVVLAGLAAVVLAAGAVAAVARRAARGDGPPGEVSVGAPARSLPPSRRRASRASAAATLVLVAAGLAGLLLGAATARSDDRWLPAVLDLQGRVVTVEGTATGRIVPGSTTAVLDVGVVEVGGRAVWRGDSSLFLLGPRVSGPAVEIGQAVRVRVSLLPVERGDPHPWAAASRGPLRAGAEAEGVEGVANGLRGAFRAVTAELPGDGGALLPGLALGDTSAVPDDLQEAMETASLTHLTAVSGSNCAVLVALVMLGGGALRVPRVVRIGVSCVVLLAFLVLVTPDASILRATVMALVVLVHLAAARPVSGLPVVALAVTGLLLADPWLARDVGFALSVLATAGLVVLARPLAAEFARVLPTPIALGLAVPAAAQLACQPVLLLLEPSLPVHGVVANVLAEPAAPVATVAGLVVCATAPWAPGLAELVARVAWVPASWVGAVARSVAAWPGARLDWSGGPAGVAVLVVASALVAAVVLTPRGLRARRLLGVALVAALVVPAGAAVGARLGERAGVPDDWVVAQCDVGQGDAVLVRSAGRAALIDVGDDEEALAGCLRRFGVDEVDLLVLTHFDSDHVGAVDVVAGRVGTVLVGAPGRPADVAVTDALREGGAEVVPVTAGAGGVLGDLAWSVLWPVDAEASGNDASVVTAWRPAAGCVAGCASLLALGDLGEAAQRRLLSSPAGEEALGPVDVVKVSHHGSADQHAELYRRARARVALIGVGRENGYGHPTDEALALVDGALVARTDLDGDAAVTVRGAPGGGGAAAELGLWRGRRG
ncbi:competence protein ComEC [Frigoribacterium sp. PvP120]|uniref:ComEC/Rec2 family competence protein n=1 Tax=unclassified Frigoribacterium TaxID=2627005 RepID=UPI001AE12807|nr:ComEC/Rec2 family competence protein [Frigoribacterium sp. PvP121]MBP1241631.1 competence protein ComEC [Frigoribacterium sp. PvP121]